MVLELKENSIYTDEEIAKELKIDIKELRKFLEENKTFIMATKIGDKWIIHSDALRFYFAPQLIKSRG